MTTRRTASSVENAAESTKKPGVLGRPEADPLDAIGRVARRR
jgi:hypothetical protein